METFFTPKANYTVTLPCCDRTKKNINHFVNGKEMKVRLDCENCGSEVLTEISNSSNNTPLVRFLTIEREVNLPVVKFLRISTPTGELIIEKPDLYYRRDHRDYDHLKYHKQARWEVEENSDKEDILSLFTTHYDRASDAFIGDPEYIIMFVGHLTAKEWLVVQNTYNENGYSAPMDMVLEIIKERTGIDRRLQFQTQDHGPTYPDDDNG